MKLLNKSIIYLSVSLLLIISLSSIFFYFNLLKEIKSSVDEGLDNFKRQIIYKTERDTTLLTHSNFNNGFFSINEITHLQALQIHDTYADTVMFMRDKDDDEAESETVRMLTSAFEKDGKYYKLSIINSMVEEDDLVEQLLHGSLWLYGILMLFIILINNFVLQRLWKPFYLFLNQLKQFRIETKEKLPAVKTNTKEFIDLQNAVHILLQRSIESFEQQKQFIGNASHELQTPLAITINKLELLIEKNSLKPEQAESIYEIMNTVERLIRLNKSLLLLTKIENKQIFDNKQINFNKIVLQNINDFEEIADFKAVKISYTEGGNLAAEMDSSLANTIISNLLRNALFHNIPNGTVTVFVSENSITISNSGSEKALDAQKIFTRFYKSEQSQNGTGLGLSIVKAICDLYGFSITYYFENSLHHFKINFK
ncbi:MAG TPA: HAMP domain-containing sensor histidine kinase [Chitinophagales bacterium]|nr:MAG: two-component sensor histidine kinase [Bacteroidetes bacterium 37-13]HRN94438.1 HAMP domain-containing sensor histidine kinase [Chitinophagales bacterium]HRP38118.1 HAMP domain-containing sensor histidine kinase [Chitinophagales bacterium]